MANHSNPLEIAGSAASTSLAGGVSAAPPIAGSIAGVADAHSYMKQWLHSLTILHRAHWDAARHYEQVNLGLGIATTITATISGTTAFAQLDQQAGQGQATILLQVGIGLFALAAAAFGSMQAFFRSSELAVRHKQAAQKFGKLRRELEELLNLGLPTESDKRERLLTAFRGRWDAADEESLPIPQRIYDKANAAPKRKAQPAKEEM